MSSLAPEKSVAAEEPAAAELLRELSAAQPVPRRSEQEWERLFAAALDALLGPESPPKQPPPARDRATLLDEIALRAAAPAMQVPRRALVRAMLAHLEKAARLNDRIFLLRELAIVGQEDAVPALARLLGHEEEGIRQYVLRALEANRTAAAGAALLAEVPKAAPAAWRVALINALGSRREAAAIGALGGALADADPQVASAAAMALGSVGTREAAAALASAKAAGPLAAVLPDARLLCADRLREAGQAAAAEAIYAELYGSAQPRQRKLGALRGRVLAAPGRAVPLLIEAMKSDDPQIQAGAARLTLEVPGAEAAKALLAALPQLRPAAQAALLEALGERAP